MNRKKIKQEVAPQEDSVVLVKPGRSHGYQSHHNLIPGSSRNKRKGNPISVPCQSTRPRHTPVSIDRCDTSSLFRVAPISLTTTAHHPPRMTRLSNLKKADESKRRSIPKHEEKTTNPTVVNSSDDEDKHSNHNTFGNLRQQNAYIKKPIHATNPLATGKSSSSHSTPLTLWEPLSKKQKALGVGRPPIPSSSSSQISQINHSFRQPSKAPYSFSQNHRRDDINRTLPYWRDQQRQINQHTRFESSGDEISHVGDGSNNNKKKTTANTFIDIDTVMDTSDTDEVYHSADSTSTETERIDNVNDDNVGYKSATDSPLKRDNGEERLASLRNTITRMHAKEQSLKWGQRRLSPTPPARTSTSLASSPASSPTSASSPSPVSSLLPSPSASASTSASASASYSLSLSSTKRKPNLRSKNNDSPAPVELSDDEMHDMHNTLFTYPINRSKGSITVTVEDQKRLEPDQFLNDTIIAFYLKFLVDSYSNPNGYRNCNTRTRAATENTHIFSSFFYNRLTQDAQNTSSRVLRKKTISYESVRKWTSKIDLFSKKYAIFPINENWHWYLVLVCNLDKCIPEQTVVDPLSGPWDRPHMFILDSLGGLQKDTMANINKYLLLEAQHRRNVDPSDFVQPETHHGKVPKQDNSCDCGVFLLHFVDQFLGSPQSFIRILLDRDAQHRKWKEGEIKEKRAELKDLFKEIHHEYSKEHGTKTIL